LDSPPSPAGASGAGVTGRWPWTPTPGVWALLLRQGAESSPMGCGPHQPLDPSFAQLKNIASIQSCQFGWKMSQGRHRRPQPEAKRRERTRIPGVEPRTSGPSKSPRCCPGYLRYWSSSPTVPPRRWPAHLSPGRSRLCECGVSPNRTALPRASILKWRYSHAGRMGLGILSITVCWSWPIAAGIE
jgi:hypothetical protein